MNPLILYEEAEVLQKIQRLLDNLSAAEAMRQKHIIRLFVSRGILLSQAELDGLKISLREVLA